MDYGKMSRAMDPLVELMERADRVRITGSGTDISFSIKGQKAIKCDGRLNIPDGNVHLPVRDSVEGVLRPTRPACIRASSRTCAWSSSRARLWRPQAPTKALNDILDTDEGARYITSLLSA